MKALLNDKDLLKIRFTASSRGVWVADECATADGDSVSGAVTLMLGDTVLKGTVDPQRSGKALGRSFTRVVGGGDGWGKALPSRAYQSDSGIRLRTILEDAAREAGETLGRCPDVAAGTYYVRASDGSRPAKGTDVLDYAAEANGVGWYVDYDGVTHVEERPAAQVASDIVVLDWDAESRWLTVEADSLDQLPIGGTIPASAETEQELTIAALQLVVDATISWRVWCPPAGTVHSPLAAALKAMLPAPAGLTGIYRYQVAYLEGDRLALSPVKKRTDIPPITKVEMAPGLAGSFATLTPGCEVYVQFVDGDRNDPIVIGFARKSSRGFSPQSISLGDGQSPVARIGSTVSVYMPPTALLTGTLSGAPFSGTLLLTSAMVGQITGGGNPGVLV